MKMHGTLCTEWRLHWLQTMMNVFLMTKENFWLYICKTFEACQWTAIIGNYCAFIWGIGFSLIDGTFLGLYKRMQKFKKKA